MKKITRMGLRKQLFLLMLILIIPILILNSWINERVNATVKTEVENAYIELIQQNMKNINQEIGNINQVMVNLIDNSLLQSIDVSAERTTFERVREYSAIDALLARHSSKGSSVPVLYSLMIDENENNYSFAPKYYNAVNRGVFFTTQEEQPIWFNQALQRKGKVELEIIEDFSFIKKKL